MFSSCLKSLGNQFKRDLSQTSYGNDPMEHGGSWAHSCSSTLVKVWRAWLLAASVMQRASTLLCVCCRHSEVYAPSTVMKYEFVFAVTCVIQGLQGQQKVPSKRKYRLFEKSTIYARAHPLHSSSAQPSTEHSTAWQRCCLNNWPLVIWEWMHLLFHTATISTEAAEPLHSPESQPTSAFCAFEVLHFICHWTHESKWFCCTS